MYLAYICTRSIFDPYTELISMCLCKILLIEPVRFRTEISVGFYRQTAKFVGKGKLNRGLRSALGLEGVAGHVE